MALTTIGLYEKLTHLSLSSLNSWHPGIEVIPSILGLAAQYPNAHCQHRNAV